MSRELVLFRHNFGLGVQADAGVPKDEPFISHPLLVKPEREDSRNPSI